MIWTKSTVNSRYVDLVFIQFHLTCRKLFFPKDWTFFAVLNSVSVSFQEWCKVNMSQTFYYFYSKPHYGNNLS